MDESCRRLAGRHALVTGGSTGIGRGIVERFLAEGARVVLASRNAQRGARVTRELGPAASWRTFDATDADAWQGIVREFESDPFDILVNNAGGLRYGVPLHEIEPHQYDEEIAANLTTVFLGLRFVIPMMVKRGGGSIINIGSIGAVRGQDDAAAYQAAKGGVRLLTKNAAFTYASAGIRVNTINPGAIATEAVEEEPPERLEPFLARTPMRRQGSPADVAAVAVLLASDEAGFITGADYDVDGGYDI